jgi:hypothetical protein
MPGQDVDDASVDASDAERSIDAVATTPDATSLPDTASGTDFPRPDGGSRPNPTPTRDSAPDFDARACGCGDLDDGGSLFVRSLDCYCTRVTSPCDDNFTSSLSAMCAQSAKSVVETTFAGCDYKQLTLRLDGQSRDFYFDGAGRFVGSKSVLDAGILCGPANTPPVSVAGYATGMYVLPETCTGPTEQTRCVDDAGAD